jgi:hypothetical protein
MNASLGDGPLTINTQSIDKVEAVGGNVEVTLTALPYGSEAPSGQIRIRFDLDDAQGLAARLTAAIVTAKVQLGIRT